MHKCGHRRPVLCPVHTYCRCGGPSYTFAAPQYVCPPPPLKTSSAGLWRRQNLNQSPGVGGGEKGEGPTAQVCRWSLTSLQLKVVRWKRCCEVLLPKTLKRRCFCMSLPCTVCARICFWRGVHGGWPTAAQTLVLPSSKKTCGFPAIKWRARAWVRMAAGLQSSP